MGGGFQRGQSQGPRAPTLLWCLRSAQSVRPPLRKLARCLSGCTRSLPPQPSPMAISIGSMSTHCTHARLCSTICEHGGPSFAPAGSSAATTTVRRRDGRRPFARGTRFRRHQSCHYLSKAAFNVLAHVRHRWGGVNATQQFAREVGAVLQITYLHRTVLPVACVVYGQAKWGRPDRVCSRSALATA